MYPARVTDAGEDPSCGKRGYRSSSVIDLEAAPPGDI